MDKAVFLAQEMSGLSFKDIPGDVVFKAKALLLDQLGCQLTFATLPWSEAMYRYVQLKKGRGNSTVVYYGTMLDAEDAAQCNSAFGHGFEMDDVDMSTTSHPAVCVVPVVLALAEQEDRSGKDVLTAMVAGYETMIRFARTIDSMRLRGFHASAISGAFGGAAATGKMLDFDEETLGNALGVVTTMAAGNDQYTQTGGTVKRTLGSTGVVAGMRAALLAQAGITGPGQALEGKNSFLRGVSQNEPLWEELDKTLADEWMIRGVGTKPYCCCAGQHAVIDATERIRVRGVIAKDIANAVIIQRQRECNNVGVITMPDDVVSAQFSGRFAFALRMVRGGNGYFDYTQENVDNPQIRDLCSRTEYECDTNCERLIEPEGPAIVRVTLYDGTMVEEQVDFALGRKENPMSYEDVVAKFKGLVSGVVSTVTADRIVEMVMGLDEADSLVPLTKLLVAKRNND